MIAHTMEGETNPTRFLNPEAGAINLKDPIPTHISAFGPKGRRLTGRLGAGWIGTASTPEGEAAALLEVRAARQAHGHNPSTLYSTTLTSGGCVLRPGEAYGSPRVLAQAGPCAAVAFHSLVEEEAYGYGLGAGAFAFREELDAYRQVYKSYPLEGRYLYNHRCHTMFVRAGRKPHYGPGDPRTDAHGAAQ